MPDLHHSHLLQLYGGNRPWDASAWVTTDDRVRGGSSISHLTVSGSGAHTACFHGHLDTSTLGGAGFASQHSRGTCHWDLSGYDGLLLDLDAIDGKRYVVTLKDDIPGRRDDGRERSGVSWEADFRGQEDAVAGGDQNDGSGLKVWLPWGRFKATYRGKDKPDAKPLDRGDVKRIGLMMRSFFDEQHGDFELVLRGIAAYRGQGAASAHEELVGNKGGAAQDGDEEDDMDLQKPDQDGARAMTSTQHTERHSSGSSWWRGVFCGLL